jgi:hypothetical protein
VSDHAWGFFFLAARTRMSGVARTILLWTLGTLAAFGLGLAAARWIGPADTGAPHEPRIMLDAGSVQLLPGASLKLDRMPAGLADAGARGLESRP